MCSGTRAYCMRRDRLYLLDLIEAAANVAEHLGGLSSDEFVGNKTVRAAVLHEFTVMGEAAAKLGDALRQRHPEVPWAKIVAFRNLVVHEYFGLSWPIVWHTATSLVPALREQVEAILKSEPSDDGPAA